MKTFLGFSRGPKSWLAAISNSRIVRCQEVKDANELLRALEELKPCYAAVEITKSYYYCGETIPSNAIFKIGQQFGTIVAALAATGTQFAVVSQSEWQSFFNLRWKGLFKETEEEFNKRIVQKAVELFPDARSYGPLTKWAACSLLIAAYNQQKREKECKRSKK